MFLFYLTTLVALFVSLTNGFNRLFNRHLLKNQNDQFSFLIYNHYLCSMKTILLHACCAPCSSAILEWMLNNDYQVVIYFCNPNIYPLKEYELRKSELIKYAQKLGVEFIDDDYNHAMWLDYIKGLENEKERGPRCLMCFKYRLLKTARKALELGIEEFTTTLASSRWKSLNQINEAGNWAVEQLKEECNSKGLTLKFDDRNWRKGGLQQRRNELLKDNAFYNQLYCGCEFSS